MKVPDYVNTTVINYKRDVDIECKIQKNKKQQARTVYNLSELKCYEMTINMNMTKKSNATFNTQKDERKCSH